MNHTFPPETEKKEKISCHFKQTEGDECFAYHFVDKSECSTCWKRYRFIDEYVPVKQEYDERMKNAKANRKENQKHYINWGNTIVAKNEVTKL